VLLRSAALKNASACSFGDALWLNVPPSGAIMTVTLWSALSAGTVVSPVIGNDADVSDSFTSAV